MTEHPRLHSIPGDRDGHRPRQPNQRTLQEPLWRVLLGEQLRRLRLLRHETLVETADRAGISPQYLSEVERGRKEPSSEMIAALAGSLDTSLGGLTELVANELRARQALTHPPRSTPRTGTEPTLLAAA
ncbi:helix-turn-helix domain-containing protein [Nocardia sp. CNY236]|uniref:helix-turn-helix domain-containing protein n=1 Tax=Nocardia sp. CNY236 TaxID=1169152 RepID=UPI00040299A7|nr:helix-turn-helix transcriptional regulator [Nocardia sp. CNY236]